MAQSSSVAHKSKPARAGNKESRPRGLKRSGGSHEENLVPMAIRIEPAQRDRLRELADGLMMRRSEIIRKGLDLGIEWAEERMKRLAK